MKGFKDGSEVTLKGAAKRIEGRNRGPRLGLMSAATLVVGGLSAAA